MATVNITIPDALIPRLTTASRALFPQYNALSLDATFKAITSDYWKNLLMNYEANLAEVLAKNKAMTDSGGIG